MAEIVIELLETIILIGVPAVDVIIYRDARKKISNEIGTGVDLSRAKGRRFVERVWIGDYGNRSLRIGLAACKPSSFRQSACQHLVGRSSADYWAHLFHSILSAKAVISGHEDHSCRGRLRLTQCTCVFV